MKEGRKVVLAGASSIPSILEIEKAFNSQNIQVEFVEATFMKEYLQDVDERIYFTDSLPQDFVVIPLTEFWISYCIKTHQCLISEKALRASRSKEYLYRILFENGLAGIQIFSYEQAKDEIQKGKSIIVKPEGLNSGLGVQKVSLTEIDRLDTYIKQAQSLKTKNLRLMRITNDKALLTEYIEGQEYSADCFILNGKVSIVRVCKKKVIIVNNKPCTLAYFVIEPSKIIQEELTKAINALFDDSSISFAQFDFILNDNENKIVIIDFACRIGGGLFELMSQAKSNPYADAIKGEWNIVKDNGVLTQLNYLPIKKGYIINDDYHLEPGYQVVFKHKGDYVTSLPSSIGSRIALVIQKNSIDILTPDVQERLLIGEKFIQDKK